VVERGNPPCPKCGAGSQKLKFDGFAQIYECANFDGCGDTFRVPVHSTPPAASPPPIPQIAPTITSTPKPDDGKELTMALWKKVPCAQGCGAQISEYPPVRAKHENACDGKPKQARQNARRPKGKPVPALPHKPATNGAVNLPAEMRERARVLRDSAEKLVKQAARLEEVAVEFETFS
jgi:ssDNA-binding Zn-finger/Zn-ribbon topoisomerase 1